MIHCKKCGNEIPEGSKFCDKCGASVSGTYEKTARPNKPLSKKAWRLIGAGIFWGVIIILVIVFSIRGSRDNRATSTNNAALDVYNSSDAPSSKARVIQQLNDAYVSATDTQTKITILKNLAAAYDSENEYSEELNTLQKAATYTSSGTVDYYYVLGEIAELQNKPADALSDLKQAYSLNPQDYQINNELGLFYLDLDSSWTSYDDNAKALQYLKAAQSIQSSDISTENLAIAYYYNNDYQEALSLFLPLNLTNHPDLALWIGLSYASEKDSTDAKIYFQKAIALGDTIPQEVTDYINSH